MSSLSTVPGDVDDGSAAVQFRPPRRRNVAARRLRVHCTDEAHVRGEVAAGILETWHRRHDEPVGEDADVEQEHRKVLRSKVVQHGVRRPL
jgi:hypothetical protein